VQVLGKWGGVLLACICLMPIGLFGQNLVWRDSLILVSLGQLTAPDSDLVKFRIDQDLEYSLTFSNMLLLNRKEGPNINQVSVLHHLKYESRFNKDRKIKIVNSFVHDLGLQCIFDSLSRFEPDENTLDTRLEFRLLENFNLSVFSRLSTRFFNSYVYITDQAGKSCKTRNESFFTPLLMTISAGFNWVVPRFARVSFGLSSSKLTYILNKGIFDRINVPFFYGVPRGKNHLLEFGLSLHVLIDHDLSERIHWSSDVLLFKNYLKPVDLVLDNQVGIRINKFLKTSIKTQISYESEVSRNLQIENMISLGFYFSL
jgi:hypothetical protein